MLMQAKGTKKPLLTKDEKRAKLKKRAEKLKVICPLFGMVLEIVMTLVNFSWMEVLLEFIMVGGNCREGI